MVLEREGYESLMVGVKPQFGETTFREFTLVPRGVAAAADRASSRRLGAVIHARPSSRSTPASRRSASRTTTPRWRSSSRRATRIRTCCRRTPRSPPSTSRRSSRRRRWPRRSGSSRASRAIRAGCVWSTRRSASSAISAEADKALKELQSQKGADVATLLFNEGAEALKLGDLDNAQSRFEEALVAQPELHQATEALMIVYARKSDWAKAAAQAEQTIAHDPANLRALRLRHEAYGHLGDQAKEKEAFEALARADPKALAGALLDSGIAKFNANDIEGAVADLSRVVEIEPAAASAHYYLGLCYTNTSKPDQAKTHLQRFLELAPDDPNAAGAREMLKYLK